MSEIVKVLPSPGQLTEEVIGPGFDQAYQINEHGWVQVFVVERAGEVGDGEVEISGGGYVTDGVAQDLSLYAECSGPTIFRVRHVEDSGSVGNVHVLYRRPRDTTAAKMATRQRKAEG